MTRPHESPDCRCDGCRAYDADVETCTMTTVHPDGSLETVVHTARSIPALRWPDASGNGNDMQFATGEIAEVLCTGHDVPEPLQPSLGRVCPESLTEEQMRTVLRYFHAKYGV